MDTPIFIDPNALRQLQSPWGHECVSHIQSFFHEVLAAIRSGNAHHGHYLLSGLREPTYTRLGMSQGHARGSGFGRQLAEDLWRQLSKSQAALTGMLVDLEDTALLVDGIGHDRISDIATNLIRQPLIRYTQDIAACYDIPLQDGVNSGPIWDAARQKWIAQYERLPVAGAGPLVFVPKVIVRKQLDYDLEEYYRYYILPAPQEEEIAAKTDLQEKFGASKRLIFEVTQRRPELLQKYHRDKREHPHRPMTHGDFHETAGTPLPAWGDLLRAVLDVPLGRAHADAYHKAVVPLLAALFSQSLTYPEIEYPIHNGRKRIDIMYSNMAGDAFFEWLAKHYPAAHIVVECKNYSGDPANPELDQISGRFSPSRGTVGLLLCRTFDDKELFLRRCRDTSLDQRGFVIPLDDGDLCRLVELRTHGAHNGTYRFLKARFDQLL